MTINPARENIFKKIFLVISLTFAFFLFSTSSAKAQGSVTVNPNLGTSQSSFNADITCSQGNKWELYFTCEEQTIRSGYNCENKITEGISDQNDPFTLNDFVGPGLGPGIHDIFLACRKEITVEGSTFFEPIKSDNLSRDTISIRTDDGQIDPPQDDPPVRPQIRTSPEVGDAETTFQTQITCQSGESWRMFTGNCSEENFDFGTFITCEQDNVFGSGTSRSNSRLYYSGVDIPASSLGPGRHNLYLRCPASGNIDEDTLAKTTIQIRNEGGEIPDTVPGDASKEFLLCSDDADSGLPPTLTIPVLEIEIPCNIQGLVGWLMEKAIAIAGLLAFLRIVYGGYMIFFSQGDPDKISGGREIIKTALFGLLFILLSAVILEIIGGSIIGIPILR